MTQLPLPAGIPEFSVQQLCTCDNIICEYITQIELAYLCSRVEDFVINTQKGDFVLINEICVAGCDELRDVL